MSKLQSLLANKKALIVVALVLVVVVVGGITAKNYYEEQRTLRLKAEARERYQKRITTWESYSSRDKLTGKVTAKYQGVPSTDEDAVLLVGCKSDKSIISIQFDDGDGFAWYDYDADALKHRRVQLSGGGKNEVFTAKFFHVDDELHRFSNTSNIYAFLKAGLNYNTAKFEFINGRPGYKQKDFYTTFKIQNLNKALSDLSCGDSENYM